MYKKWFADTSRNMLVRGEEEELRKEVRKGWMEMCTSMYASVVSLVRRGGGVMDG